METGADERGDAGRIIRLQGAHNFRDLGGYPTREGGRVARRRIFRSGALARLTEQDHVILRALGLRAIYDLRADGERKLRPSALPMDMEIVLWARAHEGSAGNLLAKMAAPGGTAEESHALMLETYRKLPYEQAESYRELFRRLADHALPVLFHCSAGKDRTGIAAALLLELFGVPRGAILEDYLLTDLFFEEAREIALHALGSSALQEVDPAIWAPLMRANKAYIETMFATVEAAHGSVAGYLREVLGLDGALQEAVRRRFVEPIGVP